MPPKLVQILPAPPPQPPSPRPSRPECSTLPAHHAPVGDRWTKTSPASCPLKSPAARITTRQIVAGLNPATTSPSPRPSPAVSQDQLLQIRIRYAESGGIDGKDHPGRSAGGRGSRLSGGWARKTAQALDLEIIRDPGTEAPAAPGVHFEFSPTLLPGSESPTASPLRVFMVSPQATRHKPPHPRPLK